MAGPFTVWQQGQGSVSAPWLNALNFTTDLVGDLLGYIGQTGSQITCRGQDAVNDGGGGEFYWAADGFFTSDGVDTIVPNGALLGAWIRLDLTGGQSSVSIVGGNPTLPGGYIGLPWDGLSHENYSEFYSYTGHRTTAILGHGISISDGCIGPPSSAGANTANSASLGLAIVNMRPEWNTSSITGESDGLSVFIRQANGDSAAILTNVAVRNGFGCILEGVTLDANSAGIPSHALDVQIGVIDSRDGGQYGINASAEIGSNLTAAFRAADLAGASWADYFQAVNIAGEVCFQVLSQTGIIVSGGAQFTGAGANAGVLVLTDTSAGLNQTNWRILPTTGGLVFDAPTDNFGATTNWMVVNRLADAITLLYLPEPVEVQSIAAVGTITSAVLGATGVVGVGASIVTAGFHLCDNISGTFTLTTGTGGLSPGLVLTVTFSNTRANYPSACVDFTGGTTFLAPSHAETTTTLAISVGVALAASTTYTISYICGGN